MKCGDLTPDQLNALVKQILPIRRYLGKLNARLHDLGFNDFDELMCEVHKANVAIKALANVTTNMYKRTANPRWGEIKKRRHHPI